jgi:tRNA splicing ligase
MASLYNKTTKYSMKITEFIKDAYATLKKSKLVKSVERTYTIKDQIFLCIDFSHAHGKDDDMYKNEEIFKLMRRGLFFVLVDNEIIHVASGLGKFYDDGEKPAYTIDDEPTSKKKVVMEKANGECFHMSVFMYNEVKYRVFGSKNVHFILRLDWEDEDLKLYTDVRYQFAVKQTKLFLKLQINSDMKINRLLNYMGRQGITLVGETVFLDGQHIVRYDKYSIKFFAFTMYRDFDYGYVFQSPQVGLKILSTLNIPTVDHHIIEYPDPTAELISEEKEFISDIITAENTEGAVVYTVYGNKTVLVYKEKAIWYVVRRMLREKMRQRATISRVYDRLADSHVEIDKKTKKELLLFYAFCHCTWKGEWGALFDSWCDMWDKFVRTPQTDIDRYMEEFEAYDKTVKQIRLVSVGIPGCGKSTLLKAVVDLLSGSYLDQDMTKGKAPLYHKQVTQQSNQTSSSYTRGVLALGKNHHNSNIRSGVIKALHGKEDLIWVQFYHPTDLVSAEDPLHNLKEVCCKRIVDRGINHLSLMGNNPNLKGIIEGFCKSYIPLTKQEHDNSSGLILIDVTTSYVDQVKHLLNRLVQLKVLDKINISDEIINKAVDTVIKAEKNINKLRTWRINLNKDSCDTLLRLSDFINLKLSSDRPLNDWKYNNQLHVTLFYDGDKSKDDSYYKMFDKQQVNLKVTEMCYDDRVVAFRVELHDPINYENKHLHITVGCRIDSTQVYANYMLDEKHTAVKLNDVSVTGTVMGYK